MSTKKMQKTLETVKGDVRELVEAFWAFRDEVMTQQAVRAAESQSGTDAPAHAPAVERLAAETSATPSAGHVELFGYYEIPDGDGATRAHRWSMEQLPAEEVLALEVDQAASILAAIGHRQRLGIVLLLLRAPATATEIVERLSLGTTGAAYHHLNVLQRAAIVQQEQRGQFSIAPDHVPPLVTILGALSGLARSTTEVIAPDAVESEASTPPEGPAVPS